ncbi:MAG: efflux RND transporter periplasmic adaptor subunit [Planctomycetota bacterium]|nr:efflux RND transporter periplasmic adaptor subunit [Planctomycetota bacterium]
MKYKPLLAGIGLLFVVTMTLVWAHEGHKAITTKGVKIDDKGILHLEAAARTAIGLALQKVDFGTIEDTVPLNARVMLPWNRKAFASTRLEGVVLDILVRPGQRVRAGEPLAVIESLPLEALRLERKQAEIELSLAKENLRRALDLGEKIMAGKEILALQAARDNRRNALATVRKKLKEIGVKGEEDLTVLAPIDGTVVHVDVELGRHVEPTKHLFEVQDLTEVWVECEVPENLVGDVELGQELDFLPRAYPERAFAGKIDYLESSMDAEENVRRAWARLENPDEILLPGMFGQAEVVLQRVEDVFSAPKGAIVTDGAERYAFVQQKEGAYKKTSVVLGLTDGRLVEVVDGLYPGDTVVTSGNHELSSLFVQGTLKLSEEAKRGIGFEVEEIEFREVAHVVEVNARVVSPPDGRGVATTRIQGKVLEILTMLGEEAEPGQALAKVQSLELHSTQLDLIQVHLERSLVEKQLELVRALARKGIPPRKELLRLESEALDLQSQFETMRRTLLVMGLSRQEITGVVEQEETLPGVTVRAPLEGRVTDIKVVVGQVVEKGEALFEVVDTRRVWVEGAFFESDLAGLFEGPLEKPVVFRTVAYRSREWESKIGFVNRALGEEERVLQGWVEVDNRDRALLPGMHAKLSVTVKRAGEKVIAVPLRAVLRVGHKRYVFVRQGKEFKRVEVELGRRDAHHAEVVRAVFPGDLVVVSGVNEINNAFSAVR